MNTGLPPRPQVRAVSGAAVRSVSGRRPRALSASRRALARLLENQPEPVSIHALSRAMGLHENTVREHLDGLIARGIVERVRANPKGRGRPAWLYRAAELAGDTPTVTISSQLAASAAADSSPLASALSSGREWGLREAATRSAESDEPLTTRVARLMDEMGFDPVGGGPEISLTRCPTLEAACTSNGVVCAVHEGFLRGLVEGFDSPAAADAVTLIPFAGPRSCQLAMPSPN